MNYIEELEGGSTFSYDNKLFLLTSDFKKDGSRMSIDMANGFPLWLKSQTIVESTPLFKLDSENNIIAIKNVPSQTQSIS